MKQLVILSGKGGTGKTTVAAAFASLASQELSLVIADADVDASNLELVLHAAKDEEHAFPGSLLAVIDAELCSGCGTCADVCRFDAVLQQDSAYCVDSLACEGCATCMFQCPTSAIHMEQQQAGLWFRSRSPYGPLFHAHLFAGQENSGKLVTLVRQQARTWAERTEADFVLIDGPPGIGCPVIAACTGVDLALHVVEPTVSSAHDLERIMATTDHFGVPSVVAINKADLNPSRTDELVDSCARRGIDVVGRIPFDTVVTDAVVNGEPVTDYSDGKVAQALCEVWSRVRPMIASAAPARASYD